MRIVQTAAALLCVLFNEAYSQFVVETNSMRVREPAALSGEFDVAIGDFGVPLYGATLVGEVVHVSDNENGCSRFSKNLVGKHSDLPVVALVHRGDCYFVEKAYNAQNAGAKAILIVDNVEESLLTMSNPEERPEIAKLKNDITIATALVKKSTGQAIINELSKPDGASVVVELDWTDSVDNPDDKVEWSMWTSSNDGCGRACDRQGSFKRQFQATAIDLEKHGFTSFEPHYMHRKCDFPGQASCNNECINHGRYCAFDSIVDAYKERYKPRQVVIENKRQLCVAKLARDKLEPWLWWQFAAGYSQRCTMANGKFGDTACAEQETRFIGMDPNAVLSCMGDSEADTEHPLLQADLQAQGTQWDMHSPLHVLLLPTVTINSNQYRGRLDTVAVLRALCAGFSETTEPDSCLAGSLQTDDCAAGNDDCWREGDTSACVDTFRGRQCKCPPGYRGDGISSCKDIDECAEHTSGCDQLCTNIRGGWECSCREGFNLFGGHSQPSLCLPKDMCGGHENGGCEMGCISKNGTATCTCPMVGLELNPADHRSCLNVNECNINNAGCEQVCEDLDPRKTNLLFTCKCKSGFAIDPKNHSKCIKQDQFLARLGITDAAQKLNSIGWAGVVGVVAAAAVVTLAIGFAAYHFRMRYHAQQQIREIMKQYMPLDGNGLDEEALLFKAQRLPLHSSTTDAEPQGPPAPSAGN